MTVENNPSNEGCISAAPTGCVSDSDCADAGRCLLRPSPPPDISLRTLLDAVATEVLQAEANWPPMNSAHEAYGVLLEEVDELWAHVKQKQRNRNLDAMRKEALQVAAMAIRFARDVTTEERGR